MLLEKQMKSWSIVVFMCIVSVFGQTPWLNENIANSHLREGDIALEDAPDTEQTSDDADSHQHGDASDKTIQIWKDKTIPFSMHANFTLRQRSTILLAMDEIQEKTCLKFVTRTTEVDYILFKTDSQMCSSLVGRNGKRQHVNLTETCVERNTVLHELMHVLGFHHEHSRHDRDKYITVDVLNVYSWYRPRFEKRHEDPNDSKYPYDYRSITHYPVNAGTIYLNSTTIQSKFEQGLIKSDGLSYIDVLKINFKYKCTNSEQNNEDSIQNEEAQSATSATMQSNVAIAETIQTTEGPKATPTQPQRRCQDKTNTSQRTTSQLPTIQSTIKQAQTTSAITITETSIGTTLKMTTSTTTRPISILNKEIIKAVEEGNENTVRKLLNEGADVNARTIGEYRNNTLLHSATEKGDENDVSLLLAHGADISNKDNKLGDAATHKAAESGYANIVSLLLAYNVSVESKGLFDQTPLHYAARYGYVNVVSLLLDKGANIEAKGIFDRTPLHYAARYGHVNVVSLLLDKGENIEAKDAFNRTPLHYAAQQGRVNVVSLLLDKGAYLEAQDVDAWTPLRCASNFGHKSVVLLLLDNGANIFHGYTFS